jgi:SAM-dependent methyltransferase
VTFDQDKFIQEQQGYFGGKVEQFGATAKGVDYSSEVRQNLCFEQLMKIVRQPSEPFTMIDYGCGYGALISYMQQNNFNFSYTGFDITPAMIATARETYGNLPQCRFVDDEQQLTPAEYMIVSGIFNLKMDNDYDKWTQYVVSVLDRVWPLATKGMSFNILTKYSDADKMRADLYYADPLFFFDYCKRHYSKEVALLHDYGAYEFTILVRR